MFIDGNDGVGETERIEELERTAVVVCTTGAYVIVQ